MKPAGMSLFRKEWIRIPTFSVNADAVSGVEGKVDVYMGIGVDAPRTKADQAVCTPDIVRRSVLATYLPAVKVLYILHPMPA